MTNNSDKFKQFQIKLKEFMNSLDEEEKQLFKKFLIIGAKMEHRNLIIEANKAKTKSNMIKVKTNKK